MKSLVARPLIALVWTISLAVLSLAWWGAPLAGAAALVPQPTPTTDPLISPTPETLFLVEPGSVESDVLRRFAVEAGWPPTVWSDPAERMHVQRTITTTQWSRAVIRTFAFSAVSEAAFLAEKEDARIAGYSVSADQFSTFPAYWATKLDSAGRVVERRLHWRAERWILGIELAGATQSVEEANLLGRRLVEVSVRFNMPAPISTVTGTPSSATPAPALTAAPTARSCPTFNDVPAGHWANPYVTDLACRDVISGYADGTFRPQNSVTRGQLVKMVAIAEGYTLINPLTPQFSDVGRDHIFYRYIETAVSRRIVTGYSDNTFRPDDPVTRAQIAKIVVRASRWTVLRSAGGSPCDVPRTHWAADYIYTAMQRQVFSGYDNGCFYPDAFATRGQIAKVLSMAGR